jgi:hypothetical protein
MSAIKNKDLIIGINVDHEFQKTTALAKKIATTYGSLENGSSTKGPLKKVFRLFSK